MEEKSASKDTGPSNRGDYLRNEIFQRRSRMQRVAGFTKLYPWFGVTLIGGSILTYRFLWSNKLFLVICLFYGVIFLIGSVALPRLSGGDTELLALENELDLLESETVSSELRAEKLFKSHQIGLKQYYDQTLRHSGWIFIVGIACIFAGFVIVGASLYFVLTADSSKTLQEKIIVASLGALAGILSNFIAAIYLKMFSETVSSLTTFHQKLVKTHHLHFANFLAAKISDGALRDNTIAEISKKVADEKVG